jgi:hypothetical protein
MSLKTHEIKTELEDLSKGALLDFWAVGDKMTISGRELALQLVDSKR